VVNASSSGGEPLVSSWRGASRSPSIWSASSGRHRGHRHTGPDPASARSRRPGGHRVDPTWSRRGSPNGRALAAVSVAISSARSPPTPAYTWRKKRACGSPRAASPGRRRRGFARDRLRSGIRFNIAAPARLGGCDLTVVPAGRPPRESGKLQPHGVFLANGPGDPRPALPDRGGQGVARTHPHLRDLASATRSWPSRRRRHLQAAVRPSRRQPSRSRTSRRVGWKPRTQNTIRSIRGRSRRTAGR